MADILVFCVRQDVARTEALAEMFRSAGFSIGDLPASDAVLRSSAVAILVWSHASVQSASFRDASRRAIRAGKALIVNLISSSRPTRIGCSPIFDLSRWTGAPDDAVLDPLRHTVDHLVREFQNQVEHWRAIRRSGEASAFVDYLARYGPDGAFSDAAEQRLDEIAFGALVGVAPSRTQREPVMEDSNLRTARARPRMNATARKAQSNNYSAPRDGAPCDPTAAPTTNASKRRSSSLSSRSAMFPDDGRGSDYAVGRQRVPWSPGALWSPPSSQKVERDGLAPSRVDDAPRASAGESAILLGKAAMSAAAARVAWCSHKLERWAAEAFAFCGVAALASDHRKSACAGEQKAATAPRTASCSARASEKARHPSPPRATPSANSSAIGRAIARSLVFGRRLTPDAIIFSSFVVGAALAGVLYLTGGGASNRARPEADIGIGVAKTGHVDSFNQPESADRAATHSSHASLRAVRRAGGRKLTMATSPAEPLVAASAISMDSDDASLSATPSGAALPAPSDTGASLASSRLATETFAFDLAPELRQSAGWASAKASVGPGGAPLLGGVAISNEIPTDPSQSGADIQSPPQESAYCPNAAGQLDTVFVLHEQLGTACRPNH